MRDNTPGLPREVSVNQIEMKVGENEASRGLKYHSVTLDIDAKETENVHV